MDINNQQEQELQQEALQEELQQERQALNLELQQLHRSLIQISKAIRQHRSLEDNLQEEQFEERGEELQAQKQKLTEEIQQTRELLQVLTFDAAPLLQPAPPQPRASTTSRSGKLPNDLPTFNPETTDIDSFFKDIEAKLIAHSTPHEDWHKAFGKSTSGTTLQWVLAKILKPALSWDKAKEIFSAEYSKADTKLRNRTKLIALRQGNRSAASYLREVEQLAPSSDQNLDDAFFINFILTERLPKSIRRQIHMRLKPEELMTLSFDRLKSEAIFIEECEASTPLKSLPKSLQPTQVRPQPRPATGKVVHPRNIPSMSAPNAN